MQLKSVTHELCLFARIAQQGTITLEVYFYGANRNPALIVKIDCEVLAGIPI